MRLRFLAVALVAVVAASAAAAPLEAVNTRKWDPTCACFREVKPRAEVASEDKPDAIAKATEEMEKHEGFFDLYLGDDGEIWITVPESLLGRMILVVGTTSRGDASRMLLNMPMGDAPFEFRLNHDGERIDLVAPQLTLRIDDDSPLAEAFSQGVWDGVTITSMEPEATREAVEADEEAGTEAVEAAYLLDITSWIMGGVLGGGELFRYFTGSNTKPDPDRSRLVSAAAYPTNLEFELELALNVKFRIESIPAPGTLPVGMRLSMVLLPEEPMVGRYSDDRAGYFSTAYYDMGVQTTDGRVARLAHRWRLEKADPDAEVSDPVTPITFYVDPTVPEQWRPYVAQGIEKWNKAYLA
ncbi:DUF5117 domain-containing protein, partial [bacterium]|nr:DUF5117 domain-containing protein [bacterium]